MGLGRNTAACFRRSRALEPCNGSYWRIASIAEQEEVVAFPAMRDLGVTTDAFRAVDVLEKRLTHGVR